MKVTRFEKMVADVVGTQLYDTGNEIFLNHAEDFCKIIIKGLSPLLNYTDSEGEVKNILRDILPKIIEKYIPKGSDLNKENLLETLCQLRNRIIDKFLKSKENNYLAKYIHLKRQIETVISAYRVSTYNNSFINKVVRFFFNENDNNEKNNLILYCNDKARELEGIMYLYECLGRDTNACEKIKLLISVLQDITVHAKGANEFITSLSIIVQNYKKYNEWSENQIKEFYKDHQQLCRKLEEAETMTHHQIKIAEDEDRNIASLLAAPAETSDTETFEMVDKIPEEKTGQASPKMGRV